MDEMARIKQAVSIHFPTSACLSSVRLFFPSRPLREVCIRKTWWILFLRGDFQCWKGNIYFLYLMLLFSSLCVSALSPSLLFLSTPFFLLFYLRSLSEGLTISSSVSLLSCGAVYCLWFAQAHPCGCLFQQPSVTWWIEEDHAEPSHGSMPLLAALGHTDSPRRRARSLPDLSGSGADGVWNLNLFSCRHQLSFCVKASGPSRHYLRGKGKIDVLPPRFSEV